MNSQAILDQVRSTTTLLGSPEVAGMIKAVADLTAIYYDQLIERGIPAEQAAVIAANYSSQITALNP